MTRERNLKGDDWKMISPFPANRPYGGINRKDRHASNTPLSNILSIDRSSRGIIHQQNRDKKGQLSLAFEKGKPFMISLNKCTAAIA